MAHGAKRGGACTTTALATRSATRSLTSTSLAIARAPCGTPRSPERLGGLHPQPSGNLSCRGSVRQSTQADITVALASSTNAGPVCARLLLLLLFRPQAVGLDEFWARYRQMWTRVDQLRCGFDRCWARIGKIWDRLDQVWGGLDQNWSEAFGPGIEQNWRFESTRVCRYR